MKELRMKVVAFNGSPRKNGNTSRMVSKLFEPLQSAGVECEEIVIGAETLYHCKGCWRCRRAGRCVIENDPLNGWMDKMRAADGIVLASPTYYANVTSAMKALIDRAGNVAGADGCLARKVGAPVVVHRRAGSIQAYNALMAFFGIRNLIVPMSTYWNMGVGREIGEVDADEEGMRTMRVLGENMVWLLQKLA